MEEKLIAVDATLQYCKSVKISPILDGYRPLFFFGGLENASGSIFLLSKRGIEKGEIANVKVVFADTESNRRNLLLGKLVEFGEGPTIKVGEIAINAIYFVPVSTFMLLGLRK